MFKKSVDNMKPKSKILVLFLLFIIIGGLLIAGFAFVNFAQKNSNKNPDTKVTSNTTSTTGNTTGNVIDIDDPESTNYKYAAITKDDIIKLYTEEGESLDINLERKKWEQLKWSEDGKTLSVLGDRTTNDIKDLNLYNFKNKTWSWLTDFGNLGTGVMGYFWKESKFIYFNQGEGIDNWMHRFSFASGTEVLKVARIDGEIQAISPDQNKVIYKLNSEIYKTHNLLGEEIWDISKLRDQNGNSLIIQNILFTEDPEKVIISARTSDQPEGIIKLFKTLLKSNLAVEIPLEFEFHPLCSVNKDVILGYVYDEAFDTFVVQTLNVKTQIGTILLEENTADLEINFDSLECIGTNNIIAQITNRNGTQNWVTIAGRRFSNLEFLQDIKEVEVN
jgi:hypothetical protein